MKETPMLVLPVLFVSLVCQTGAAAPAGSNDPNFIATPADLKARIPSQLHITKPDYVVFVPEVTDSGVNDTGNEHFLVFDGPDGSLMAVWTQSSAESQPDQHIAFSHSKDEGRTWEKPRIIAGPRKPGDGHMASWGYPLVSKSGRIYVLYSQHIGRVDNFPHHTGWLHGIYSDDNGTTWSAPQNIPIRRSVRDNPDPTMPPNMLCWQKPLRLGKDNKYFAGFTRWTSFKVTPNPTKSWISADSRVEFMRFENIDDNPEVKDIKISWFASDEKALSVPFPGHPEVSACQEPTVVRLPDGRLFCVMRTASGSPYWSVSSDIGETWTQPRVLLRRDGGAPLLHPLSPCPMYDTGGNTAGSGNYVLFIHNHDGHYKNYGPTDTSFHRRPINIVRGSFKAGADQPVWFDEPQFFFDHDGVSLGKPGTKGRMDLALYSSFTVRNGVPVLWYPERKFFLLGRKILPQVSSDKALLAIPGKVVYENKFDSAPGEPWKAAKGKWELLDGAWRGSEKQEDNHGAVTRLPNTLTDFIIEYEFKFDGAKSTTLSINAPKAHMARISITTNSVTILRDDYDKDGPAKAAVFARFPVEFANGTWHKVRMEMVGDVVLGKVDDLVAWGKDDYLKNERVAPGLTVSGQSVDFRNFSIREATLNPDWENVKSALPKPGEKIAPPTPRSVKKKESNPATSQ